MTTKPFTLRLLLFLARYIRFRYFLEESPRSFKLFEAHPLTFGVRLIFRLVLTTDQRQ